MDNKKSKNFLKDIKQGGLTKSLGKNSKTESGTLKVTKIKELAKNGTPKEKKQAVLALNMRKWNKGGNK